MMRNSKYYQLFMLMLTACSMLNSCSISKSKTEKTRISGSQDAAALFESFTYIGSDDFYNENALSYNDSYYNPILPGWYSDPSVCTNGEDYFLVVSTFTYFPGVPLFHSKDLVNWTQVGHVLNRPSQMMNMKGQHVSGGIFAPAIEYNPANKTYYMITTNVGAGNFFVKTTDPFGEWSDPIMLPEVGGIDPSFFFDDNGRAYIVNNDDAPAEPEYSGHRTIRIREFDVANDKVKGEEKILVNKGACPEMNPIWIEGPHLYKINGKYFLMSAEGGTGGNHSEVIFRGDSPMGPFTPWENNPILTQRHLDPERHNPITCAGHADLIQTKDGDWWAVFLACRPINNTFENLGRETFLMPVKWSEDGFPYMTQGEDVIPMVGRKPGVTRSENVTFGNLEVKDDFNDNKLAQHWITLRNDASEFYSLNENPGFLTLKCSDVKSTDKCTPAFISRRMQHHKFECSTRISFEPQNENEAAGLLLFKDETHQYFFSISKKGKNKTINLIQTGKNKETILASEKLIDDASPIELKVVSHGTYYDFIYTGKDGVNKQLAKNIDASYLSTGTAGGFTGSVIGMYAVK